MIDVPPPVYPWPIGVGPRYQPSVVNARAASGAPIGPLRCGRRGREFAGHVELFANRRVVIVPKGIGVARTGCRYPLHTSAPTGVVHVNATRPHRLRDLFAVWGRRLGRMRLLSFRGRVLVFVDGRRFRGDPGRVLLTKHRQIVVEVGGYVAPHPSYLFPKGLQ
jgi:hypothetical protein